MIVMKARILQVLIVISASIIFSLAQDYRSCEPAEEFHEHQISFGVRSTSVENVKWGIQQGGDLILLSTCDTLNGRQELQCDPSGAAYNITGGVFYSSYTIEGASVRQDTQKPLVAYIDNTQKAFECLLSVYAKPTKPSCNTTLSPGAIQVTCTTDKVYPQAECTFYRNSFSHPLNETITYTHDGRNEIIDGHITVTYYKTTCSTQVPFSSLGPGSYSFYVNMYPKVTRGDRFGVNSDVTSQVVLAYPTPSKSNCPSGSHVNGTYIKTGTSATCTCVMTKEGSPPGQVRWYDSTGTAVDSGATSATLNIPGSNPSMTYTCRGTSSLGTAPSGVTFTPVYAVGPTSVSASVSQAIFDICPNNADIILSCEVRKADVTPGPVFKVQVNGTQSSGALGVENTNSYIYNKTLSPDIAGRLTLTCNAENSKFSDVSASNQKQVEVRAPPSSTPKIQIIMADSTASGAKVTVTENVKFTISCQTEGGVPAAYITSLSCGSSSLTPGGQGNTLTLTDVVVSRTMNGQQCTCTAQHVTSCYSNNKAAVTLNVQYRTSVRSFKANSIDTNLEVSNGSAVTFVCEADGNPLPTITVLDRQGYPTQQSNKLMACGNTGTYTCNAGNKMGSDTATLNVLVKCAQQLKNLSDEGTNYQAQYGDNVTITVDVFGYPAPNVYILQRTGSGSTVAAIEATNGNGHQGRYSVMYTGSPYISADGRVELTILNMDTSDFGNYTMVIRNSVGRLSYSFFIEAVNVTSAEPSKGSDLNVAAVAGGAAAALIVILIVGVLFVLRRRGTFHTCFLWTPKQRQRPNYEDFYPRKSGKHTYSKPCHKATQRSDVRKTTQPYEDVDHPDSTTNTAARPDYVMHYVVHNYDTIDDTEWTNDKPTGSHEPNERGRNYVNVDAEGLVKNDQSVSNDKTKAGYTNVGFTNTGDTTPAGNENVINGVNGARLNHASVDV